MRSSFSRRQQHNQLHKRQSGLIPTLFNGDGNIVTIPPVTITRGGQTFTLFPTETANPVTRVPTTVEETTIATVAPPVATTLTTTSQAATTSASPSPPPPPPAPSSSSSSSSSSSTASTTSVSSTRPATTSSTPSSSSPPPVPTTDAAPPVTSAPRPGTTSTIVRFQTETAFTTQSGPATRTSASHSESSAPVSHGLGAGAKTGFAVAGVIGGLCLLAAVWLLIQRCRRRKDDEFDPDEFRRKSVALRDDDVAIAPPPMAQSEFGSSPRPPTMIERHNTPPVFRPAPQAPYGHPPSPGPFAAYSPYPEASFNNNNNGYGAYNNGYDGYGMAGQGAGMPPSSGAYYAYSGQAYGPGDVVFSAPPTATIGGVFPMPPTTPGTPVAPYAQNATIGAGGGSMFAPDAHNVPLDSPTVSDMHFDARHDSVQSGTALMRRPTNASLKGDEHYVDLDRSSVSPYQALQYAEIQRKLSASGAGPALQIDSAASLDVPTHGAPVSKASEFTNYGAVSPGLAVSVPKEGALPESPFTDPAFAHRTVAVNGEDQDHEEVDLREPQPAFSRAERIPSMPPMLPEVERSFSPVVYDFAPSISGTSGTNPSAPVAATTTTPAPVPASAPAPAPAAVRPAAPTTQVKRPDTVYTVYDPEDAYGGI